MAAQLHIDTKPINRFVLPMVSTQLPHLSPTGADLFRHFSGLYRVGANRVLLKLRQYVRPGRNAWLIERVTLIFCGAL